MIGVDNDRPVEQGFAVSGSISAPSPVEDDGLARSAPSAAGVDAAQILAFIDDVEAAGLELHDLMIWRGGAVVAEAWRWPYGAERLRSVEHTSELQSLNRLSYDVFCMKKKK